MKKQAKILLFALLVVLMAAMMVVVASAAETVEGAEDAYWKLEQASGTKYYSTLNDAIAAIEADGAVITLQMDSTEDAPAFNVPYQCTVDGNDKTLTLNPKTFKLDTASSTTTMLYFNNGKTTIKDLTLKASATTKAHAYVHNANGTTAGNQDKLLITFENVVCDVTSNNGIILAHPATLTFNGAKTSFTGSSNDVVCIDENGFRSRVYFNDGRFACNAVVLRTKTKSAGSRIEFNGGRFETKNKVVYFTAAATNNNPNLVTVNGGVFEYKGTNTGHILFDIRGIHGRVHFPANTTAVLVPKVAMLFSTTMDANYWFKVEGGTFVLDSKPYFSKMDETILTKATILFDAVDEDGTFMLTPGNKITVEEGAFMPTVKFAGKSYKLYMTIPSNAKQDIVTEETFGAAFYLGENESETGLRFTTFLSDSIIALAKAALDEDKTVSYGTLIAPADYVAAAGAFTKEALEKLNVPAGKQKYADVPARYSKRDANGDGVCEAFSATLVNIQEENYERMFAAVAYVVIDGETYYSAYNTVDNARCLRALVREYVDAPEFLEILDMLPVEVVEMLDKYYGVV